LAYAKTVNKPIMLDFTGYACVNCRKMENNVWSDAMILPILNNEVVLISLYVDDKRDLPKVNNLFRKQLVLKLKQ
jgi:thiol:disulfide interchange protein DsbD